MVSGHFCMYQSRKVSGHIHVRGCRGRMVFGYTTTCAIQGRIQDFKLGGGGGGGALKKIASSGGRREKYWGISCEKSRFYAKKSVPITTKVVSSNPAHGEMHSIQHKVCQ